MNIFKKISNEITRFLRKVVRKISTFLKRICYYLPLLNKFLPPKEFHKCLRGYSKQKLNFSTLYPYSEKTYKQPITIDKNINKEFLHTNRTFDEEYVVEIRKTRVIGEDGILILPDNKGVIDINLHADKSKDLSKFFRTTITKIPEKTFYLGSTWWHGYYHWMFEVLPKLHLLEKSGLQADYYLTNRLFQSFHHQSLELLEIDKKKIIETEFSSNIKPDSLIVTSLPGSCGWQRKWQCEFLKDKLASGIKPAGSKKIYISRENATIRRVLNEDEVLSLIIEKYGFEKVNLEDYSLKEQISILKSSEYVIAPHGGGITNIVFCEKPITLIELFPPDYINVCFWSLANVLGYDYRYIISSEVIGNMDIIVDIDKLKKIIHKGLS